MKSLLKLLSAMFLASCATPPAVLHPDSLVVVKEVPIPTGEPWYARFAVHTFIDYRADRESGWKRIEIVNKNSGLQHHAIPQYAVEMTERWKEPVRIIGQSEVSSNPGFAKEIEEFAAAYDTSVYRPWPGPNSNTFAEKLIRKVDGISASLDHNAVGKEYGFYAGRSAGGDGFKLQTPVIGTSLGVRDGIEISLFGFSGGIAFSPPGIKIPFLPRFPKR